MVRPALAVIPMGWHSAVGLVQEAVRTLVFERAQVPKSLSIEKGKPLPQSDTKAIVYLDNFDEIHVVKKLSEDFTKEGCEMSEYHKRFVEVCDQDGLPRNAGKQLIHAYAGGLQGGLLDGKKGVLRAAPDKLQNFLKISFALLAGKKWSEFHLRHWAGKAAFIAAFRRMLFSNMFQIFPLIEQSRCGDVLPTRDCLDEIVCVGVLSVIAQANLRAPVSEEISCTDASPTGGATAVAKKFKISYLQVPDAQEDDGRCAWCEEPHEPGQVTYPCSRKCGLRACSPMCAFTHAEGNCTRKELDAPTFGERFAGQNFPLTQAVALEGIAIQPPLDIKIASYAWDYFSESGKRKLDLMENDCSLAATHWAPECKSFTAARGRPITLPSGRTIPGPKALRSRERPWGLPNLSKDGLQGFKEALEAGRIVSLEHPWNSLLWWTPEAEELFGDDRVVMIGSAPPATRAAAFGGWRTKWTCLITNDEGIFRSVHRPECPGHWWLRPYEVHETPHGLKFDTEEEAEYPWDFCTTYAAALRNAIGRRTSQPVGSIDRDHLMAVYSAVKRATKGLQRVVVAMRVATAVNDMLKDMCPGNEAQHLASLLRQVSTRGCDIKILVSPEDGEQTLMAPYPSFAWLWRTLVAYRWRQPQHINTLEVSAFLVEIRRRARDPSMVGGRFINVTDSQVTFHCLTKGRSSSAKLNRLVRRVAAVSLVADLTPFHVWTISKWNFADYGSRKFEVSR